MISVTEKKNAKTTFIQVDKMPGATSKAVRGALYEIGSENVNHLRKMIRSKDKTGRRYGSHQASAPGEAPAARPNSRLTRTLQYKVRGDYQVEFGDTAPYGGYLEEGTKNIDGSIKMAARPHVNRTVKEKEKDTRNTFEKYLDPKRMLK